MGNLIRSNIADIDLLKPLKRENTGVLLAADDQSANRFGANVYKAGESVDLTGYRVIGYFIRPTMDTLPIDGTVEGNTAYVDLPAACYASSGAFALAIKVIGDDVAATVRVIDGYIRMTETDSIVPADEQVININELLQKIEDAEAAAERAEAAADRAEAAGGGSGGTVTTDMSAHIINLTDNGDGTYTADTTFAEAEAIFNSGRELMCINPIVGAAIPLTLYMPNEGLAFAYLISGAIEYVMLSPDGAEVFSMPVVDNGVTFFDRNMESIGFYNGTEPIHVTAADMAYVKSVNGVLPDSSGNITISVSSDSGSETVPDYVTTEAETVARLVNQHQSNDSIIIPFLTDAHCGYYQDTENAATKLAGQLLDQIGQRVPFDIIINGGDMANGAWDTTRDLSYEQIEDYTQLMSAAQKGVPSVWAAGNHDDAPYMATADRVTQTQMFALIGRKNRLSNAVCPNGCNYGYIDLENRHLRVIYLDTDDKRSWGTVQVGSGETGPDYLNAHNLSAAQLSFLANTALDFSDKEDPAEWDIVVASHVALNVTGSITDAVSGTAYDHSTANAATILAAYGSGSSGSITHNGVTVAYDYSALEARASVICCVHGHNHKFSSETLAGGILSIGCPNVMNGRERASDDGNTYTKTADTADGTSFCIITIDRENQLIYADCVGAGYDREFEYTTEVVAYTNLLPISTDADGAIYNGVGYKADTYLSSGVDGTKTGIYASGYIQGVANEYGNYFFYLKNVGMQTGQDSHRVALYDGTKTYITTVKTTVTGNPFTYGDDGNIAQLMFTGTSYPDGLYIRICCGYLGDDSIITANEPIE